MARPEAVNAQPPPVTQARCPVDFGEEASAGFHFTRDSAHSLCLNGALLPCRSQGISTSPWRPHSARTRIPPAAFEENANRADKLAVTRFFQDAGEILNTAAAATSEESPASMAILIDRQGGLRIVEAAGWNPRALEAHYGAETVYQITRTPETVQVMGISGAQTCRMETARPQLPFQGVPNYAAFPGLLPQLT